MVRNLHKCTDTSVHLHICIYMYIHGIYMFTYLWRYKHVYKWYRRVYTTLPNPVHMVRIPDATKSFMISSLKRAESYRIWLSGEDAMAGRENRGNLWDLTSGLDLQLPIVCTGFRVRTLSLASASVQILGRWDARLMKLVLDRAWAGECGSMCLKRGSASSNWLNWDWDG